MFRIYLKFLFLLKRPYKALFCFHTDTANTNQSHRTRQSKPKRSEPWRRSFICSISIIKWSTYRIAGDGGRSSVRFRTALKCIRLQSFSRQTALCWIANKNRLCLRLWHLKTLRVSRASRDGSVFVSAGSSGSSQRLTAAFPWMRQCDSSHVNVIFRQTADTFQVRASPLLVHVKSAGASALTHMSRVWNGGFTKPHCEFVSFNTHSFPC